MFLVGSKVLTAFISPIVPIEIISSMPAVGVSNFLAMYTTSRRLCVMRRSRAVVCPRASAASASRSCSGGRGGGRVSAPLM